jgi:aspartyl-tRNA(Asn)/glutamyl-tRNA(Gln) amidotransferase subunit C
MINKEKLNNYAEKLMFRMKDEEYNTLLEEFEIIEKQMELIGKIEGINEVEPMVFPYKLTEVKMREDNIIDSLNVKDALKNAKNVDKNQIKVPKVVE